MITFCVLVSGGGGGTVLTVIIFHRKSMLYEALHIYLEGERETLDRCWGRYHYQIFHKMRRNPTFSKKDAAWNVYRREISRRKKTITKWQKRQNRHCSIRRTKDNKIASSRGVIVSQSPPSVCNTLARYRGFTPYTTCDTYILELKARLLNVEINAEVGLIWSVYERRLSSADLDDEDVDEVRWLELRRAIFRFSLRNRRNAWKVNFAASAASERGTIPRGARRRAEKRQK